MNAKQRKTLIIGSIAAAVIGAASGWVYSTLVFQGQQMYARMQQGQSLNSAVNDQVRKMDQANVEAVNWFANGLNGLGQTLDMAAHQGQQPATKNNNQE